MNLARQNIPLNHPLQRISTLLSSTLTPALQSLFEHFDDELFERARQCRSNQEQETWLTGMRQMRLVQHRFTDQLLDSLREGIEQFYRTGGQHRFRAVKEQSSEQDGSLSLLEGEQLELTLAITDLRAALEQQAFKELYPLEKRLAVLLGQQELQPEHNPLGVDAWCQALRLRVGEIDTALDVRLLLLKKIATLLRKSYRDWLQQINQLLIDGGLLPDFKFDGIRRPSADSSPKPGDTPDGATQARDAAPAHPPHPSMEQPGSVPPGTPAPQTITRAGAQTGTPFGQPQVHPPISTPAHVPPGFDGPVPPVSAPAEPPPSTPWWQPDNHAIPPADPAGAHPWQPSQLYSPSPQQVERETRLYQVVQSLLEENRPQRFSPHIRGLHRDQVPNRVDAQISDVIGILTVLQNALREQNPERLEQPQNIAQVKQQIANQLLELETEDATPVMSELTEDIIDLVGMLFEYILEDEDIDAAVKVEIFKLELPMLKVALMNEDFFRHQDSPPRALLEALADLGRDWIEGGERERVVMPLVRKTVQRVLEEFDHNLDIFEQLCEEIATARKKAEQKFERNKQRSTETFHGRERLFLARQKANETVEKFTRGMELSPFMQRFFHVSWANYLALTITRHGEESPEWESAWQLTDTLVQSIQVQTDEQKRQKLKAQLDDLRKLVLKGLLQTGTFETDARKLVDELTYVQGWALSAQKPEPMPEKLQVLDEATLEKVEQLHKKQKQADRVAIDQPRQDKISEEEALLMAELEKLPFGTWLEYRLSPDTPPTVARLAWYSPQTRNCLLVNKSGQALMTRHILTLARDIIAQRCRVLPQRKRSLIERGMNRIRKLLGGSPRQQTTPADRLTTPPAHDK